MTLTGRLTTTSNMTGRHWGSKHKCTSVCRYVAQPGECYYNTLLCCDYHFSSLSVVLCAFSALCAYSTFGHHPHPLGYLCAKFCVFHSLHCWASLWRKIVYSITHSITQLIWCPRKRSTYTSKYRLYMPVVPIWKCLTMLSEVQEERYKL